MSKEFNKKNLIIVSLIILILIIPTVLLEKKLLHYYAVGNSLPQLDKKCHEKEMIWDKGVYLIDKIPNKGKIVLKVENRNEEAWYISLLPVQSSGEQFKTCIKGVEKYPTYVENSAAVGKEIRPKSKGLVVSIGIQQPFKYFPIAHLILNIRLFSSRFNDESYNLDAAMQNIVENFYVIRESDNSWHIYFKKLSGEKFDKEIPFQYDLVSLNGKEININSAVEFISKDNGNTWNSVVRSEQ